MTDKVRRSRNDRRGNRGGWQEWRRRPPAGRERRGMPIAYSEKSAGWEARRRMRSRRHMSLRDASPSGTMSQPSGPASPKGDPLGTPRGRCAARRAACSRLPFASQRGRFAGDNIASDEVGGDLEDIGAPLRACGPPARNKNSMRQNTCPVPRVRVL
jgi:hypothetical protein